MDYVLPKDVVNMMITSGINKAQLSVKDLLIRGFLSGALLGFAVTLAFAATSQTSFPIIGAIIFPTSFVMIVLLGLELVTGSFALVPLAYLERKIKFSQMCKNLWWVFFGNLLGGVVYAIFFWISSTKFGNLTEPDGIAKMLITATENKTLGYSQFGFSGIASGFVKAVLCNWMVCLGVVMAMTSKSTVGKIFAAWIPIFIFFALGYEHSVVNMFLIPAGMLFGAKVSVFEWWFVNQLPVTLGNLVGGLTFTGLALYITYKDKAVAKAEKAENKEELNTESVFVKLS